MTEQDTKIILNILKERFGLDELDRVELIMEYEKMSGEKIPEEWFVLDGVMCTPRIKQYGKYKLFTSCKADVGGAIQDVYEVFQERTRIYDGRKR